MLAHGIQSAANVPGFQGTDVQSAPEPFEFAQHLFARKRWLEVDVAAACIDAVLKARRRSDNLL